MDLLPLNIAIRMVRGNRTQDDFAEMLGVTGRTVSRWENEDLPVSLSNLRLLVGHGLPQQYLLSDEPQDKTRDENSAYPDAGQSESGHSKRGAA